MGFRIPSGLWYKWKQSYAMVHRHTALVELIVNAMVDMKEPFLQTDEMM